MARLVWHAIAAIFIISHNIILILFFQNEMCVAFGPGKDMFDSTRIIGERQYSLGKVKT